MELIRGVMHTLLEDNLLDNRKLLFVNLLFYVILKSLYITVV